MSLDTELLQWQNNIARNKKIMQLQRKTINIEEWANYLQKVYPTWWEQEFKDIWFFNIIYYPPNHDEKVMPALMYRFHASRFSTMQEIRYKFNAFISQQHSVIKLCFGNDIYEIIKNYLPQISNLSDNYIYVHKYFPDEIYKNEDNQYGSNSTQANKGLYFTRFKTTDDLTLNRLLGKLPHQDHSIINLRIRSKKFSSSSKDLTKKIYLNGLPPNPTYA